jgi:RimJ/RimL family protein N-acetyltransferase
MTHLTLRPFVRENLPLTEPWFSDVETERWLGGTDWPRKMLDLTDRPLGEFRGAMETGRFRWVAWNREDPVGYIDCGTFDRWTTWDLGVEGGHVVATIEAPAAALAYVVDPQFRGRGFAKAMIQRLIEQPELSDVEVFGAGVEPDNVASVRALLRTGFRPLVAQPDFEGFVYFVWRRSSGLLL